VQTTALNGSEGKRAASPSITRHPAFPAIVALWFAALLGLGTLVLPAVLLERIVSLTGISSLVPQAVPPLGFTARAAIAGVAGVLGAVLGLVLARRVQAGSPAAPRRTAPAGSPRPLNAHEDLDLDRFGPAGAPALANAIGAKRRALAMVDENQPSEFLNHAPLPGDDPWAEPAGFDEPAGELPEPQAALLDLDGFASSDEPFAPFAGSVAAPVSIDYDLPEYPENHAMSDKQEFQPLTPQQHEQLQHQEFHAVAPLEEWMPETAAEAGDAAQPDGREPEALALQDEVEPLAFAAPSQAHAFAAAAALPSEESVEEPALGQLVQRLGSSMQQRREALARRAAEPVIQPAFDPVAEAGAAPVQDSFEAARPEEAAQAMAAFFGKPAAIPQPRQPASDPFGLLEIAPEIEGTPSFEPSILQVKKRGLVDLLPDEEPDGEDDEYLPSSFSLPLRRAEPAEEQDADEDSPFGSLLELGNPFLAREQPFVRVEEPDVAVDMPAPGVGLGVAFPGSEAAAALPVDLDGRIFDRPSGHVPRAPTPEMDDALRSALSKLQRMSGAA